MKIFRNIRQQVLNKGKMGKYIKYAIGEILLVMIGILLALQVNNWNENRKQDIELKNILQTVSYDLETDTLVANQVIKIYDTLQKKSQLIINRELNLDNYKECPECVSLTTFYVPLNIQTKGYELLKNISNQNTSQKDSLITDIIQVYDHFKPVIEKNNERLEVEVMKNLNAFREFPWFVDLTTGKFNKEMVRYFTESEDYRKRVALHNMLASNNHLAVTKQYKNQAIEFLDRIRNRLKK